LRVPSEKKTTARSITGTGVWLAVALVACSEDVKLEKTTINSGPRGQAKSCCCLGFGCADTFCSLMAVAVDVALWLLEMVINEFGTGWHSMAWHGTERLSKESIFIRRVTCRGEILEYGVCSRREGRERSSSSSSSSSSTDVWCCHVIGNYSVAWVRACTSQDHPCEVCRAACKRSEEFQTH
jgi:hypothetical protein